MTRILQNFSKRAIGVLNAGMTMNAVAMNIACFTRAIRHLRQCFQATGRTTLWTSSRHDAWPRQLYSEHPTAQSLPNCHSYCC